jgi:uncharacterized protein (TIGR01777 family)
MKALVTGATGFIGPVLLSRLEQRVVLTRNVSTARAKLAKFNPEVFAWDADHKSPPAEAFQGVEAVFHLAGDSVAEGRWTAAKKQRLVDSRVNGTRHLLAALRALSVRPKVLVSASAVGFYGDRGDAILDEQAAPGTGFLADLCRDWEREAMAAESLGIRVVTVRIGIVLGKGGGALGKMLLPFQLGVGSPLGSGKQYMPWIHVDDLADLMMFAATHDSLRGPVNGTAPEPVTNAVFTHALGRALGRPTFFPAVPSFALRLMLGEFGDILLHSQRVIPRAALNAGFTFAHEQVAAALNNICRT